MKYAEKKRKILQHYMDMTDYAYRHGDLGMMDIEYGDVQEDERLDAMAEVMLNEHMDEVENEYSVTMAMLLDEFYNMPADGRFKGRPSEGTVTDLTEREGFNKVFISVDDEMGRRYFIDRGGHAWDGLLPGHLVRYQKIVGKDGSLEINLFAIPIDLDTQSSMSQNKKIYKAYIVRSTTRIKDLALQEQYSKLSMEEKEKILDDEDHPIHNNVEEVPITPRLYVMYSGSCEMPIGGKEL